MAIIRKLDSTDEKLTKLGDITASLKETLDSQVDLQQKYIEGLEIEKAEADLAGAPGVTKVEGEKKKKEDDPFKIAGKDLTYNQLTDYLKNAYGAYDFYRVFPILEDKGTPGEVAKHFPNLTKWVLGFKDAGIIKSFHSSNLLSVDAGGIPWEHFDPSDGTETPGFLPEFLHIKTDCDRPFYMLNIETNERTFMNTRVAWWNERDWHGGLPIYRPTYTLRINGYFTDEFKRKVGIPV
jgi:hypothetical protein